MVSVDEIELPQADRLVPRFHGNDTLTVAIRASVFTGADFMGITF
jgi:hypothetical protein